MARGKLESAQQKAVCPTDLSSGPENDLVELVWENGQIMMQGQSNRSKRSPSFNDIPSQSPVIRDKYTVHGSSPKFLKFGGMESILDDAAPSVPSAEISLSHDDEMVPWLNYPMNDGLRQDFCSELLPEISGVTGNEPSNHNSFATMEKRNCGRMVNHSHIVPVHNGVNADFRNGSKVCSSSTGLLNPYSSLQGQISFPSLGSGVSDVVVNSANHKADVSYGDSNQGQSSGGGLVSMKMQSKNVESSSGSGSRLLNFSHFSRPTALIRANLQKTDGLTALCSSGVEKIVNEEKEPPSSSRIPIKSTLIEQSNNSIKENNFHNQPSLVRSMVDSRPEMHKPLEEACTAERADALCQEDSIKNDNCVSQEIGASTTKGLTDGEKSVTPVVAASSVCSGNSAERTSNDQTHNSKRKHRDNDESESRSEDIEEESAGNKKPSSARGGSGSKRSRAAEVHNLSERRRRDRINEKMRALQELIPNCNKADKASMLDEAIEYLKTLQLQVQIMSMGAGLCMPPMMFPTGLQHMHAAHMPHFTPMGSGMSMGMGFGMGMLDMNTGSPRFPIFPVTPMQGAHFPSPPISGATTFPGIGGSNLHVFGHPGQGLAMPVARAPFVPMMRQAPLSSTVGLDGSKMGVEALRTSPVVNRDVPLQNKNSQLCQNAPLSQQTSAQLTEIKEAFDQPASLPKDDQVNDASVGTREVSPKEGSE